MSEETKTPNLQKGKKKNRKNKRPATSPLLGDNTECASRDDVNSSGKISGYLEYPANNL